jgi:hypothetical protein
MAESVLEAWDVCVTQGTWELRAGTLRRLARKETTWQTYV